MSKRIPFDIKYRPQIESGEYRVETRDGRPVRIICWDCNNYNPIIALADETGMWNGEKKECMISFGTSGSTTLTGISQDDPFVVIPEEELTDFENAFGQAMMEAPEPEEKKEWYPFLKEKSSELLSLARKQIEDDIRKEVRDKMDGAELEDLVTWNNGYNYGKKIMREEMEKEIEKAYKNVDKIQYQKGQASAFDFIAETVNSLSDLFQEKMSDYARKNFNGDSNSNN